MTARAASLVLAEDHRLRVARLLRGDRRVTDLDRLFGDRRHARPGRDGVREVGHFAAHRSERNLGIGSTRAADIQTSMSSWARQVEGKMPTFDQLLAAGAANLAILPADRLRERLRTSKQATGRMFRKAVDKIEASRAVNLKERDAVNYLGFAMTWQFAFDAAELVTRLCDLLVAEGSLENDRRGDLEREATFVTLYALALMHGARLKLPDGSLVPLRLAAREETGTLRTKAEIPIPRSGKPMTSSVSMFETELAAAQCDIRLLERDAADVPAEVDGDRVIALV